ncbi:MAG: iron ABC transporter permease [Lachnospiraceae bacterium]|nr:iron ABC transporter permease [Lachnospiraceae bacterium]
MKKTVLILSIILIAALVLALFLGNDAIGTGRILEALLGRGSVSENIIVFKVRIPRIVAASFCGAALSVSGYILQKDLNNRIASPGLLGINNGAGLFVLISAVIFPYQSGVKCLMAFIGALLVTFIVSLLSKGTGMSKTSVILSGVAISAVCVSVIDLIISLKPETVADKVAFQLGGFANVQINAVKFAVPVIIISLLISLVTASAMDIMALGDEAAIGLGLNVRLYRTVHILCAALLAGAAVSLCGLLGFVGLMVPNFIRLIYRGNSLGGLVLNMLAGAAFLLVCDTLARLVAFPYEIPCGLILSILGGPFLIGILIRKRKRLGLDD